MPIQFGTIVWGNASSTATATAGLWIDNSSVTATAQTGSWSQMIRLPIGTIVTIRVTTTPATVSYIVPCTSPTQWQQAVRRRAADRAVAEYDARWEQIEQERQQRDALRRATMRQGVPLHRHNDEAKQRARALLLEHLTPAQRETFERRQWFVVEGGKSKTKYRINAKGNLVANIDVLDTDRLGRTVVRHRLCAHCDPGAMPLGDHLLAQKLMLEFDEDDFLRIANRH